MPITLIFRGLGKPQPGDKFNARTKDRAVPGKGYPILTELGKLIGIATCDENLDENPKYQNVPLCGGRTTNTAQNVASFTVTKSCADGWENYIS